MKYAAFMLVRVTPEWLALGKEEREAFEEGTLGPILERHAEKVGARWFDAEAFSGRHSDVVLFEAEDRSAYYALVEGTAYSRGVCSRRESWGVYL